MKKLVLVIVATLVLVGCGSTKPSSQVLSCETSEMGMDTNFDITFSEEKVTDVAMVINMPYELMGMTYDMVKLFDEKELQALVKEQFAAEAAGEIDLELTEEAMKMTIKVNVNDFIDSGLIDMDDANEKVNINEAKSEMEKSGAVCNIK